jgi:hypothetical protein
MFEVTIVTVHGKPAIGSAGPFTLVVDRPADAGGGGVGFNGGQLLTWLWLAASRTISFREALAERISLTHVSGRVVSPQVVDPW